jgi:endonuclease/exonuclease/phosphatase (EEP) superfamily protein YafD
VRCALLQRILLIFATATLFALGLLSVLCYIAWFWPLELLTHFRIQYLILSLIVSTVLVILWRARHLKSKALVLAALLLVGLNGIEVIPWYLPHSQQMVGNAAKSIRILSFNINTQNNRDNEVIKVVRDNHPDVALFIEVDRDAVENLKTGLKDTLPYSFRSPGGGLALLSRFPIQDAKGDNLNGKGGHNLIVTLEVDRQLIKLIGTHPLVQRGKSFPTLQ